MTRRLSREAGTRNGYSDAKRREERVMPPRGVKKGTRRARQYEHVKDSLLDQGRSCGPARVRLSGSMDQGGWRQAG